MSILSENLTQGYQAQYLCKGLTLLLIGNYSSMRYNLAMSSILKIHPATPQKHLIAKAANALIDRQLIVMPTDTSYSLVCCIDDKKSLDRIKQIRQLDDKHQFTLICHDLSQLGNYAKLNNQHFRTIKSLIPGAFTFILNATSEVPKRLQVPNKKSIGLRVPDNNIALAILEQVGEPLLSTTLIMPGDEYSLTDPEDIAQFLSKRVDIIINNGYGNANLSTIIDMTTDEVIVTRKGQGIYER